MESSRTGQEIALIPELCFMTGLTPDMRANFNTMKDINNVLQKGAKDRCRDIKEFQNSMVEQPKVKALLDQWGLKLDTEPLKVYGQQVPAG